jgi:hypothetical protein
MYAKFLHALMKRIRKAGGSYQSTVQTNTPILATASTFSQSDAASIPTVGSLSPPEPMHALFDPSNQPPVRYEEPISPRTVPTSVSGQLHEQVPMQVEQTYNAAFGVPQAAAGMPAADDAAYWNNLMWPGVGWPIEGAPAPPPPSVPKPPPQQQPGFPAAASGGSPQTSSAGTPGYAADPYQWLGLGSNPSVEGWFAQYASHPHPQQQQQGHPTNSPTPEQSAHMQGRDPQFNYGHSAPYYTGQPPQAVPSGTYH